ncbi:hypothetical protein [Crocosphaera sp. Alani8]
MCYFYQTNVETERQRAQSETERADRLAATLKEFGVYLDEG